MKLAFVTDSFVPDVNGAARSLAKFVDRLELLGHEVRVIRTGETKGKRGIDTVVPYFEIPRYPEIKIGSIGSFRFVEIWRKWTPDAVYIAMESPMGCTALKACKELGIPVVSGFHTNFHHYTNAFRIGFLKWAVLKHIRDFHNQTEATVVPSYTVKNELDSLGFERLNLVSRGVDTVLYNPEKRSEKLRQQWQASGKTPVVGYVGRVSLEKNLRLFFKTLTYLREQGHEPVAVVVGDGPLLPNLKKKYPDCIFTGCLSGQKLSAAYASIDVFLFPSLSETFGNSVTEALASGTRVVAYDYASAQMHIKQGINGYLAPPKDEQEFIQQAEKALKNVEKLEIPKAAKESVQEVSWEAVTRDLLTVFEKVCK